MRIKKVAFKIFCITGGLLLASSLIIYLTLYFSLPNYYYRFKETNLQRGVKSLIYEVELGTLEEAEGVISNFVHQYNARAIIINDQGFALFFSDNVERIIIPGILRERVGINIRFLNGSRLIQNELQRPDVISLSERITFKGSSESYELIVLATLQPINEASNVIIMFLPYMSIAFILVAVIGAVINSGLISKPLIHLNQTAKKMAELDFTVSSNIQTEDELGELSSNLNKLSENLKRSMNELRDANAQLKDDIQKEREQEVKRREFIDTISHELKTPLTAVTGQLEGMIENIGVFRDRDKYLRQSYQIMKEMEILVHEILDLSQLEGHNFRPQIQRVNLSRILNRIVDSFFYFQDLKHLKFHINIQDNLYIEADEKLITKAITNVISNGIKYSGENERIIIKLFLDEDKVQLRVINTGTKIEESQLEKIFEPFYRIEKSRNRRNGGSGLGLYIVKKILEMHAITYSICNVAEGVCFSMTF